ncbi:MAG: CARDB domain-containing protein, partial [Gammaproteobacteria bacterium]
MISTKVKIDTGFIQSVLWLLLSLPALSVPAVTVTQTDTFDTFSCGAWQLVSSHSPDSYISQCSGGWIATTSPEGSAPPPGTSATVSQLASTGNPSPSAQLYIPHTGGGTGSRNGMVWLYKQYRIKPGVPIDLVSLQYSHKRTTGYTTRYPGYEIRILNGKVSNLLSGDLPGSFTAESGNGCNSNGWCAWTTYNATNLVPSTHTITVAFKLRAAPDAQSYAALDNVKVEQTLPDPVLNSGETDESWAALYHGVLGSAKGVDIKTDSSGNVYVTGRTSDGTSFDVVTIKYDSQGTQKWVSTYDGGDADEGVALALDSSGNVLVAARSNTGTNNNYIVIKYDTNGVQQWASSYDNLGYEDNPSALGVDNAGNVIVTGYSGNGLDNDYATVQFDTNGIQQWASRYDNGGFDEATDLQVDTVTGDVYVTGYSKVGSNKIATVKYNNLGVQQWQALSTGGTNEYGVALGLDSAGNTFVTGRALVSGLNRIVTIKYNASGARVWRNTYSGAEHNMPVALDVDGTGNVVVGGRSGRPGDYDAVAVKYDTAGTRLWNTAYGASGTNDELADLVIDPLGNILIAVSSGISNIDYVAVKFDQGGVQVDEQRYNNSGNDVVTSLALGADSAGESTIHVTGTSYTGMDNEIATIKYSVMRPDLTISAISGPATGLIDGEISVNNTVENVFDPTVGKSVDAGAFDTGFYLAAEISGSPDLNQSNWIALGNRSITSLNSGASDSDVSVMRIPLATTAGNYYLAAIVDNGAAVVEKDETNNILIAASAITINDAPDLVATTVSGPATADAGSGITINYGIDNTHPTAAGSFDVSYVLSTDTVIGNGDDVVTGSDTVAGVTGNSSVANSVSVTIPNTLSVGSYYIGMIVDSATAITEPREDNNTLASVSTISVTEIPDLTVTALSGPAGAASGETFNLSNTVKNINGVASGSFTVGLYLSTDSTITTSDTLIGSRVVGSLAANSSSADNTSVTIPASMVSGIYYLGAIADTAGAVTESDETNNALAATPTLSVAFVPVPSDGSDGAV